MSSPSQVLNDQRKWGWGTGQIEEAPKETDDLLKDSAQTVERLKIPSKHCRRGNGVDMYTHMCTSLTKKNSAKIERSNMTSPRPWLHKKVIRHPKMHCKTSMIDRYQTFSSAGKVGSEHRRLMTGNCETDASV